MRERILIVALICTLAAAGTHPSGSRPNILIMVGEDHGLQLSCYGDPVIDTPHLDALAQAGIRFENAYVAQAGCSPSRAALLTGQYPHTNGQIGLATHALRMVADHPPNLTTALKQAGYRTGIIGKLHVHPEAAFAFDVKRYPKSNFGHRPIRDFAREAGEFFQASCDPFLLWISFPDAHAPFHDQQDGIPQHVLGADDVTTLPMVAVSTPQTLKTTAGYYNSMRRLDTAVGLVLQELSRAGCADPTLVIFLADHGPDFPRAKKTLREGGTHVPLILRWPGHIPAGRVEARLVSSLDLLPTILEAAGISGYPGTLQGRPLQPLFHPGDGPWRNYLFTEFNLHWPETYYPGRAVRDGRFKLVHNLLPQRPNPVYDIYLVRRKPKTITPDEIRRMSPAVQAAYAIFRHPPEYELYDLQNDPWEMENLAEDGRFAEPLQRLKTVLSAWQVRTNDPLRHADILARFTAENDATMSSGQYRRKSLGQWQYPDYFNQP